MSETSAPASAAQIIARRLRDLGCRHAFGIPGGEVLAMMNALEDAGIAFTLTKHENGAGFMAEGAHHANGAPGILLATIGPGLANAVNVIANAEQDRVPMIVLTGCVDAEDPGMSVGAAQELGGEGAREHQVVGVDRLSRDLAEGVDPPGGSADDPVRALHREASRFADPRAANRTASRILT